MADVMNHGRPERAWCDEGLMSRAGPANAIAWKNLSSVSRDPGTAIPGSRLTGLGPVSRILGCVLSSNEVHFVSLAENFTV